MEPTRLFYEEKIKINVGQPDVRSGGFFTSSYIVYSISTEPFGWSV